MVLGISKSFGELNKTIDDWFEKKTKHSKALSTVIGAYSKILTVIRSGVSLIDSTVTKMPKTLVDGLKVLKGPLLLNVPFTLNSLLGRINKVVHPTTSLKSRISQALKSLGDIQGLAGAAATVCEIGKIAGIFGQRAVSWIPILGYAAIATGTISLAFTAKKVVQTSYLVGTVGVGLIQAGVARTKEAKEKAHLNTLERLQKIGIEKVTKRLGVDSEADVGGRIENLRAQLLNGEKEAASKAKKFLGVVVTQGACKLGLHLTNAVGGALGITSAVFGSVVPMPPVSIGLGLGSATLSLGSWAADFFLMNPNPFSAQGKSRARKIVEFVGSGAQKIGNQMQEAVRKIQVGVEKFKNNFAAAAA